MVMRRSQAARVANFLLLFAFFLLHDPISLLNPWHVA